LGNQGIGKHGAAALRQIGAVRLLLTVLFLGLALYVARHSWTMLYLQDAEAVLFDFRSALATPAVDQDQRIILIPYDDETLALTGKRSPLDRTVLAKALRRIDSMGAKSIGIDILIDQPQPEDPVLVKAFQGMKTPTFLAYAASDTNADNMTPAQQQFLDDFLKQLAPGNVHPTSIRLQAEADNVVRRWPQRVAGLPPTMPNALDPTNNGFRRFEGSIQFRRAADPTRGVFAKLPIQSFISDDLFAVPEAAAMIADQIKGRHVIIGGHIVDTDLFSTPVGRLGKETLGGSDQPNNKNASGSIGQTWGMDVFAQMLAQQLDGTMPTPISGTMLWLAAMLAVGAAVLTALSNVRLIWLVPLFLLQLALMGYLPFLLQQRMVDTYGLPMLGWTVAWIIAFTAAGAAARAVGAEQRRFAQGALGKYLPRDIAAEILRNPDGLKLHGEKREIFALFTDLEGFTKLSHAIEPEMVATLLNTYLETLSDVVLAHGGTIDKFVGDAVVAFWGAPISRPDDGERAIKAGWAMYQAGEAFRRNVPDGVPAIGCTRVGVHYGHAIVGNFGGEGRIQYTALGDSMNTAARLESANKQLKSKMLVSQEAAELADIDWLRPLGTVVLRGRATPVEVFEPVPDADPVALHDYAALVAKAGRRDPEATAALGKMADMHPQDAALRNLVYRLNNLSEGGIFVLD
jgi:adenylate cyclase